MSPRGWFLILHATAGERGMIATQGRESIGVRLVLLGVFIVILGGSVSACANMTEPPGTGLGEAEIPPPLGKDSVVVGDVLHACSNWKGGGPPEVKRIVVDLFFGRAGPWVPGDRPLEEHVSAVESVGGVVLHRFNFPAVRADFPTAEIPSLADALILNHARAVPYSDRFDWQVAVGYLSGPAEEDFHRFEELGGVVSHTFERIHGLGGEISDHSIPTLRKDPNVVWVEASGIGCVAG